MAYEFKLPDIGEGLTEGEVVKWLVQQGDTVTADQPMVEVMTDKATVEITAPVAGTIAEIRAEEGKTIPVGSIMVVIDDGKGAGAAAAAQPKQAPAPVGKAAATKAAPPAAAPAKSAASEPEEEPQGEQDEEAAEPAAAVEPRKRTLAAPATRKLARELGLDLAIVPATGPHGRVTRADVEAAKARPAARTSTAPSGAPAAKAKAAAPTPRAKIELPAIGVSREDRVVALRGLRGKIADQMQRSKQMSPHFTFVDEVDMTRLAALRQDAKSLAEEAGLKLTYLPFIMKALVAGFRKFPAINSVVDDANRSYVIRGEMNFGIATDTDDGLTVPVIKNVDRLNILQIAGELQRVTEAARAKKIGVEDLKGGTFTITSAGSIGGIMATPILNYPEVGILGVYKIADRPVVRDGAIVVRKMANLSITLDHRIVDGATAAHFLNEVIRLLENPALMLLEGM